MAENTREIILDTLLALERGEEFSHKLIKAVLDKYDYLEGRDKAFIKRVTEGTIERQLELDYYLNHFSSVPVRKMKPLIRCLLRMSAYQLLYMDTVPDSAVCNEACKLAAKRKFHNLKGFVNGVLRNIAKNKDSLPLPDEKKDISEYLSVRYSMPKWLVEHFLKECGEEVAVTLLEGLLQIHSVSIRFRGDMDKAKIAELVTSIESTGAKCIPSAYLSNLFLLDNVENISKLPGFAEGYFTVQDVSSVLAVLAADIKDGDFVMDICAAPGGKTMLAAEKAEKVLARDVSDAKVAYIEENLERMQLTNVAVEVFNATQTDDNYIAKADVLIMDVPCSGLGVMGKKRDIKYHASPEGLKSITELQKQIVEHSWQYVKPGGILLYSTCTINRAENEDMVQWIVENLPFEPEGLEDVLPEKLLAQKCEVERKAQKSGVCEKDMPADSKGTDAEAVSEADKMLRAACIQLLPGYMEADGFFFARLRRKK